MKWGSIRNDKNRDKAEGIWPSERGWLAVVFDTRLHIWAMPRLQLQRDETVVIVFSCEILELLLYYIPYYYCSNFHAVWTPNTKDILMHSLTPNARAYLLAVHGHVRCVITVFFSLCSSLLFSNAFVILMWIPWFIMFWTLIIVLIISVQPCKLTQAINLRFERNKARPRRCWCTYSRILTGNGSITPSAEGPDLLLLIGFGSVILEGKRERERKKGWRFSLCFHAHQNKSRRNSLKCIVHMRWLWVNRLPEGLMGMQLQSAWRKDCSSVPIEPSAPQLPGHHHCATLCSTPGWPRGGRVGWGQQIGVDFLPTASKSWALRLGSFVMSGPWHLPPRAMVGLRRDEAWKCSTWSLATTGLHSVHCLWRYSQWVGIVRWKREVVDCPLWLLEISFVIIVHTYV